MHLPQLLCRSSPSRQCAASDQPGYSRQIQYQRQESHQACRERLCCHGITYQAFATICGKQQFGDACAASLWPSRGRRCWSCCWLLLPVTSSCSEACSPRHSISVPNEHNGGFAGEILRTTPLFMSSCSDMALPPAKGNRRDVCKSYSELGTTKSIQRAGSQASRQGCA